MKRLNHTFPGQLLLGGLACALSTSALAGAKIEIDETKWVSLGAGLRTSFSSVESAAPDTDARSKDFNLDNARLYIAGQVHEDFKFYFGTDEIFDEYGVLDAIIQYEPSEKFNIWMGRMLTPADRIEMNGPFYGLTWNQYTVPLFPSDNDPDGRAGLYGRDDGVTAWGTLGKFQYAVGIFDGFNGDANQDDSLLYATRVAYNFLNLEQNPGYYTSSTYFGKAGDILTVALSAQHQAEGYGTAIESGSFTGYAVDALFEKAFGNGSALTVEGEFKSFDVSTEAATPDFPMFDGDAYFLAGAYLFASKVGLGQFQPYLRYTFNEPTLGDDSDLTELGVNYVIDAHKLKLNLNYTTGDANLTGVKQADRDSIVFGMQYQI